MIFKPKNSALERFQGFGSLYLNFVTSRVLYLISAHTYPCQGGTLIGVCKGFSGGRVAGDFQVGLVFGPGFGQQPDPVPEPALVHQTAQPIDAAPEYADLPFRLLPTVAMLGSKRLGRRPQVAWGDPAVMGVFRPPVVAGGRLWCRRPRPGASPPKAPASGGRRGWGRSFWSCPTSSPCS